MFNNDYNINSYPNSQARQSRCGRAVSGCECTGTARNAVESEQNRVTYGLIGYPLASVYAPLQNFTDIYDCETGLSRGTIFSELDLPFLCGGMNGGTGRG